jgi:hypothetical protein
LRSGSVSSPTWLWRLSNHACAPWTTIPLLSHEGAHNALQSRMKNGGCCFSQRIFASQIIVGAANSGCEMIPSAYRPKTASIRGSATLCSSRWTQWRGRQLHRLQYRREHRARLLSEKALRSRRSVRPREEKVVNRGEALPLYEADRGLAVDGYAGTSSRCAPRHWNSSAGTRQLNA